MSQHVRQPRVSCPGSWSEAERVVRAANGGRGLFRDEQDTDGLPVEDGWGVKVRPHELHTGIAKDEVDDLLRIGNSSRKHARAVVYDGSDAWLRLNGDNRARCQHVCDECASGGPLMNRSGRVPGSCDEPGV